MIEFNEDGMELGERVPASVVFVDGSGVGDVGPDVMREREALSQDGIVLVHLIMDQASNCLKTDPEITSHGFIVSNGANEVLLQTRKKVVDAVAKADGSLVKDVEQVVRTFLYNETHRQPMIFVTVSRL